MVSSEPKTRTVADIMSSPVVTATEDETIATVSQRMGERRVGSVVVIDASNRPIGIFTERDFIRLSAAGTDSATAKLGEWMTPDPDTVGPDVSVSEAFDSLAERGYRHIPVVHDNVLVGLISMRDLMGIAAIQPSGALSHEVPKGLEGVVVAETEIGDVRGTEGFYHYREYNAIELAEKRTLEDVWHLMIEGYLPRDKKERDNFIKEVEPLRHIPPQVAKVLPDIAELSGDATLLNLLRTTISIYATELGFQPCLDVSPEELRMQALRTCAVTPVLLMSMYRLRKGEKPIDPNPELPYASNYLYMMNGEIPNPEHARAVEQYMISTIDHGFNASTFTARVITSTGADLGSAVVGAIGALSGPLHGGAPSRALDMLDQIGTVENAEPWLRAAVERGDRLMGFGHRVYKTEDPRSVMLRQIAERLDAPQIEFAKEVEKQAIAVLEELKPGRMLYTNVEFYLGVVMEVCGVPPELFTPTFASSRMIGWTSHVVEQASDNRLIRPSANYRGPKAPQTVPTIN